MRAAHVLSLGAAALLALALVLRHASAPPPEGGKILPAAPFAGPVGSGYTLAERALRPHQRDAAVRLSGMRAPSPPPVPEQLLGTARTRARVSRVSPQPVPHVVDPPSRPEGELRSLGERLPSVPRRGVPAPTPEHGPSHPPNTAPRAPERSRPTRER